MCCKEEDEEEEENVEIYSNAKFSPLYYAKYCVILCHG